MFMSFKLFLGVLQNLIKFWGVVYSRCTWVRCFLCEKFQKER